jgi:hypothetical protein
LQGSGLDGAVTVTVIGATLSDVVEVRVHLSLSMQVSVYAVEGLPVGDTVKVTHLEEDTGSTNTL